MTLQPDGIEDAAALFRTATSAVAFTGAGISTPSGIPDFRDPESGLWAHTDPLQVASIYGFRHDPYAFFNWVYPLARQILDAKPNPAHQALAELESFGLLRGVITQNIDLLHSRAGSKTVLELHGSLREATCTRCFKVYPGEPLLQQFLCDGAVPRCRSCGGVLKPNIILFGEQLPYQTLQAARRLAATADVFLIVGSSLEVAPASEMPAIALRGGAKLIIVNLTPTDFDQYASLVIRANAAEVLPALRRCIREAV